MLDWKSIQIPFLLLLFKYFQCIYPIQVYANNVWIKKYVKHKYVNKWNVQKKHSEKFTLKIYIKIDKDRINCRYKCCKKLHLVSFLKNVLLFGRFHATCSIVVKELLKIFRYNLIKQHFEKTAEPPNHKHKIKTINIPGTNVC